jgi:hypothetical protein
MVDSRRIETAARRSADEVGVRHAQEGQSAALEGPVCHGLKLRRRSPPARGGFRV